MNSEPIDGISPGEGVYPLFYLSLTRFIAEVEHHTYFQLPVTYCTNRITQTVLLILMSWQREVEIEPFDYNPAGKIAKKYTPEEWVFVESAFNVQSHIAKNTLLHTAFSVILPAGKATELPDLKWN